MSKFLQVYVKEIEVYQDLKSSNILSFELAYISKIKNKVKDLHRDNLEVLIEF